MDHIADFLRVVPGLVLLVAGGVKLYEGPATVARHVSESNRGARLDEIICLLSPTP